METIVKIFISWFPMILLIGVWIYFMKRGGLGKQASYMEQLLAEQKILNEYLGRIAQSLEELASK